MGNRISESLRSEVKQRWLNGESRNKIAAICGISQGAASAIIDEWKKSVGVSVAEQQRDLFTAMNRQGISIVECAQGFRIGRILKNIGVNEDRAESFLEETYNRCIAIGFIPEDIATHFSDLISFATTYKNLGIGIEDKSEWGDGIDDDGDDGDDGDKAGDGDQNFSHPIPSILQIAKYLEKTRQEINKSKLERKGLKKEIELREAKKLSILQETEAMLSVHRMTAEKLDWCVQLKTELLVSGHSENDFEPVLDAINLVKGKKGSDLLAIAAQFSEHEQLKSSVSRLEAREFVLEGKVERLHEQTKISEQTIESKSQLQWHMLELERMGFGLKQLTRLYNVIKEITEANGYSEADGYAAKMFMDQVERNYDVMLGFEKKVNETKEELQKLNICRLAQLNTMSALPYVGAALRRLLNRGLQEDDIVKQANLMERPPDTIHSYLNNDRSSDSKEEHLQQNNPFNTVSPSSSSSAIPSTFSSPSTSASPSPYSSLSAPSQLHPKCPSQDHIRQYSLRSTERVPAVKRPSSSPQIEHNSSEDKNTTESTEDGRTSLSHRRRSKKNQDQTQFNNPTLDWTPTFFNNEVMIPEWIISGLKDQIGRNN